jgi:hypothetical protein
VAAELQEGSRHLSNALVLRASEGYTHNVAVAQRIQRLKSLQEPLRGGGGLQAARIAQAIARRDVAPFDGLGCDASRPV